MCLLDAHMFGVMKRLKIINYIVKSYQRRSQALSGTATRSSLLFLCFFTFNAFFSYKPAPQMKFSKKSKVRKFTRASLLRGRKISVYRINVLRAFLESYRLILWSFVTDKINRGMHIHMEHHAPIYQALLDSSGYLMFLSNG